MPKYALNYAGFLGAALCLAACGFEPLGDGGTGSVSEGTTTGILANSVTAGTTGADAGTTGGGVTGSDTTGAASAGTTAAGTTTGGMAGTTGGTAGTTGGTAGTTTTGGNACTPDGWDNYAKAKFNNSCAGCHGISFSTLQQVVNDKTAVQDRIKSKNMPRASTLDTDTYTRLLKWMDCGLPQ